MRYLIGIGTYAGFDDSIGLRVAEAVSAEGLDRSFRAIELGGAVIDLLHYLDDGTEELLIVDAARMGLEPGEHAFFTPDQVDSRKRLAGVSTHEGDVMKALELAASLGRPLPAVTFLGIEPGDVCEGIGLSPELEARLPEYVQVAVGFFG